VHKIGSRMDAAYDQALNVDQWQVCKAAQTFKHEGMHQPECNPQR